MSVTIGLKPSQEKAYQALLEFINNPVSSQLMFTLSGAAGTGKSWITQHVIMEELSPRDIIVTAPTNKAKKVIASRLPSVVSSSTIHSLLGLKVKYDYRTGKEKLSKEKHHRFGDYKVVFVDECSMVGLELYNYTEEACEETGTKVVFIGDKYQLPPVGEQESLTLNNIDSELTEIVRQQNGNPILDLVTTVRENIGQPNLPLVKKTNYDKELRRGYIWTNNKDHFIKSICTTAKESMDTGPDTFKVIAWRNKIVDEYNSIIRNHLYGSNAEEFLAGEWLIVNAPSENTELYRSDDIQVIAAKKRFTDNMYVWEIMVKSDDGNKHYLNVIANESTEKYKSIMKDYADRRLWKQYFQMRDQYDFVNYSYAITAHKSQGSTYESVFVDDSDIYLNRNSAKERNQMLYVAYSRASERLMIYNKYAG